MGPIASPAWGCRILASRVKLHKPRCRGGDKPRPLVTDWHSRLPLPRLRRRVACQRPSVIRVARSQVFVVAPARDRPRGEVHVLRSPCIPYRRGRLPGRGGHRLRWWPEWSPAGQCGHLADPEREPARPDREHRRELRRLGAVPLRRRGHRVHRLLGPRVACLQGSRPRGQDRRRPHGRQVLLLLVQAPRAGQSQQPQAGRPYLAQGRASASTSATAMP